MRSRETLAKCILRRDALDKASNLLALDFYFDDMSSVLDLSSQSGIVSSHHLFHEYSVLMRDAALIKAPLDSPGSVRSSRSKEKVKKFGSSRERSCMMTLREAIHRDHRRRNSWNTLRCPCPVTRSAKI